MKIVYQKNRLSGSIFDNLMGENVGSEEKSDARCGIPVVERNYGEFLDVLGPF